jgi:hypothetical protein
MVAGIVARSPVLKRVCLQMDLNASGGVQRRFLKIVLKMDGGAEFALRYPRPVRDTFWYLTISGSLTGNTLNIAITAGWFPELIPRRFSLEQHFDLRKVSKMAGFLLFSRLHSF